MRGGEGHWIAYYNIRPSIAAFSFQKNVFWVLIAYL